MSVFECSVLYHGRSEIWKIIGFLWVPSVLWRCWLGGRKGIWPVKLSVWSEVQTCVWPSWCHCHSLSLAPVKSRLVLPLWYRLTRVVIEKRAVKQVSLSLGFNCKLWGINISVRPTDTAEFRAEPQNLAIVTEFRFCRISFLRNFAESCVNLS